MKKLNISKIDVVIDELKNVDEFSVYIVANVGSSDEKSDEHGLSHFLEHMMFKGTNTRNNVEIVKDLEKLGSSINAYTTKDYTAYTVKALTEYQSDVLDIFFDMVTDPIFKNEEFEKEKNVIIEEINMYKDNVVSRLFINSNNDMIKGQYNHEILGEIDDIKNFNVDKLRQYYLNNYTKDNLTIYVVGNFSIDILNDKIEKYFSKINSKRKEKVEKKVEFIEGKNIYVEDNNQVNILLSYNLDNLNETEKINLTALNYLLSSGLSSKLFIKMREELALAYSIYSYVENLDNHYIFRVYIGTNKDKYLEAINGFENILEEIIKENISDEEIKFVKNNLKAKSIYGKYNTTSRLKSILYFYMEYNELATMEEILEKYENINNLEMLKLINKILNSPKNISISGKIEE